MKLQLIIGWIYNNNKFTHQLDGGVFFGVGQRVWISYDSLRVAVRAAPAVCSPVLQPGSGGVEQGQTVKALVLDRFLSL